MTANRGIGITDGRAKNGKRPQDYNRPLYSTESKRLRAIARRDRANAKFWR